jgi:hypothetical protein
MYSNVTPDLARARINDRLARAEARRLAAAAKQARPPRQRASIRSVLPRLRPLTRRPVT